MRSFSLSAIKQMLQSKTRKLRVFLFNEVLYHLTKWMQWSLLMGRSSTIPINAPNTWPCATKTSSFLNWSWFLFNSLICTLRNTSHKIFSPSILIMRIPHHIFKNSFSLLSLQDILIPMSCWSLKQQTKKFLYMLIIMSTSYYLPLYLQAVIYRKFRFCFTKLSIVSFMS